MYRTHYYLSKIDHYLSRCCSEMDALVFRDRIESLNKAPNEEVFNIQVERLEAESGVSYGDVLRLFDAFQQDLEINNNPDLLAEEKRRDAKSFEHRSQHVDIAGLFLG